MKITAGTVYEHALLLATKAHAGQTRWNGDPYVTHPIRVAARAVARFDRDDAGAPADWVTLLRVTAVLHDTVEDTDVTFSQIESMFGPLVAKAVALLTRRKGDSYSDFIRHLVFSESELAIRVKLADLEDNMSDLGEDKASLLKRYKDATASLESALREIRRD